MDTDVLEKEKVETTKEGLKSLILHNDDKNDINYIEASLCKICGHTPEQAIQCATIAHYKGKCEIKSGDESTLRKMKMSFDNRDIITSIE